MRRGTEAGGRRCGRRSYRRVAIACATLLCLSLGGPAAAQRVGDRPAEPIAGARIESFTVKQPGRVLIDAAARSAWLKRQDAVRRRFCPAPQIDEALAPVKRLAGAVDASRRGAVDRSAQPFAVAVMQGAAAALAGDEAAARSTIRLLENWARADALSELVDVGPERSNFVAQYSLRRVMMAVIPAWALLADRAQPETRRVVRDWIAQRVVAVEQPVGPADNRRQTLQPGRGPDYYQLLRDAVLMSYGALTGDNERFQRGIAGYFSALRHMREDGSLPLEMARGSSALWYQRHAIASLVTMAQIAKMQGYPLYEAEIDGKRLLRAVNFLLAEATEPRQISSYATDNQDLAFLQRRNDGRHFMAWIEPWLAHASIGPIPDGDPLQVAISERPLMDELAGGNTTCLLGERR